MNASRVFGNVVSQPACIAWVASLSLFLGCSKDDRSKSEHGPFGPAVPSRLLSPFQGTWRFSPEKTLEAQKAAGANEEKIAQLRKMYEASQKMNLNASLTIVDNEALGDPFPSSEYRFFHLHRHDGIVCGKAWHHEDRFDPGDMSKCYVQLAIVDGCLHFRSRMTEGLPALNDPDLKSPLPVDLDSDQKCEIDMGDNTSELMVFVRAAANEEIGEPKRR